MALTCYHNKIIIHPPPTHISGSGKPFFLYYAFQHMHAPQFSGQKFRNSSKRGNYGDSLREVNWAVSQVLQALSNTGVSDNTVIFLTADNG